MKPTPAIMDDRLYIKITPENKKALQKTVLSHFERFVYLDEGTCKRCPVREFRPSEDCEVCPNFGGLLSLWKKKKVNGQTYIGVPAPHLKWTTKRFPFPIEVVKDFRPVIRFKSALKWTGRLYRGEYDKNRQGKTANQVEVTTKFLKHIDQGGGIIRAAARSGKTAMAVFLSTKLRQRTLIIAGQIDWLRQFGEDYGKFTNVKQLFDKRTGKGPVVLVDRQGWKDSGVPLGPKHGIMVVSDWSQVPANADVVMSTYQIFITDKGRDRLKKHVHNRFSVLVNDETHQSAAAALSEVLLNIKARVRIGLTATPNREDTLSFLVREVMGPVIATSLVSSIIPRIELWETGIGGGKKPKKWNQWYMMERWVVSNQTRNEMIVRQVFKDLRSNPKHCILIPTKSLAHIAQLVKMINDHGAICRGKGEDFPLKLAYAFHGKVDRVDILRGAANGKYRVIVAIPKMLRHGLTLPAATHVYMGVLPSPNGPMFYQSAARTCTPYAGKPQPVVRLMIDAFPISVGCFKGLFFNPNEGILDGLKRKEKRWFMDDATFKRAMYIAQYPRLYEPQVGKVGKKAAEYIPLNKRTGKPVNKQSTSLIRNGIRIS